MDSRPRGIVAGRSRCPVHGPVRHVNDGPIFAGDEPLVTRQHPNREGVPAECLAYHRLQVERLGDCRPFIQSRLGTRQFGPFQLQQRRDHTGYQNLLHWRRGYSHPVPVSVRRSGR